jgi:hypothetical protein
MAHVIVLKVLCLIMYIIKMLWLEKCSSNFEFIINFSDFYLWVLHPVGHLSNWFLMMPSIATKFQYVLKLWRHHKEPVNFSGLCQYWTPWSPTRKFNLLDSDWLWTGRLMSWSWSPDGVKNFNFSLLFRPALGSTQPPIQWALGALPQG